MLHLAPCELYDAFTYMLLITLEDRRVLLLERHDVSRRVTMHAARRPILGAICDTLGVRAGLIVGGMAALVAATWGATHAPAADAEADSSPQSLVGAVGGLLGAD
jgi:hypothetical protein